MVARRVYRVKTILYLLLLFRNRGCLQELLEVWQEPAYSEQYHDLYLKLLSEPNNLLGSYNVSNQTNRGVHSLAVLKG